MSSTTTSQPNWKNVNNWHWVEKNCFPWADEYLRVVFQNFTSSDSQVTIKIKRLDTLTGDVNVSQRKGKIFYFFDLKMTGFWKAETNDKTQKCSGTFSIDEFSNELKTPNDIYFKITVNEDTNENAIFRSKFASVMKEPFFTMLERFMDDLEKTQGPSVIVPESSGNNVSSVAGISSSTPILKEVSDDNHTCIDTQPNPPIPLSTGDITQQIYFMTEPNELFDILTNPLKIAIWSRSTPITPAPKVTLGEYYHLFGSSILYCYTNLKDDHPHTIEMDWRYSTWPKDYFSRVHITLTADESSRRGTKLDMLQTGVPSSYIEILKTNWNEYYWNAIKALFGL